VQEVPAKFEPDAITAVPTGPVIGLNVNVGAGPTVTVNEAVAESSEPAFVVTVTV
jgi:hypothetical protein